MELLVHSRAPGKLLLSGEHATVYGKNAVAVTVDLYTETKIFTNDENEVRLKLVNFDFETSWSVEELSQLPRIVSPDGVFVYTEEIFDIVDRLVTSSGKTNVDNSCRAFLILYLCIGDVSFYDGRKSMFVEVNSNMPNGAGLGSSSSYIVSLANALFTTLRIDLPKAEFNQWCYEVDKLFHGKPSGVDNTICTYGGAILFGKGKVIEQITNEQLGNLASMRVLLVNTNVPRNTKVMVERCRKRLESAPEQMNPKLESIATISQSIWDSMKSNNFDQLPQLFERNQILLNELDVGHEKIDEIVGIAKSFGLSAKLTGAGGGGIVLVFIPKEIDLTPMIDQLRNRNFTTYNVKIGVNGVETLPESSK